MPLSNKQKIQLGLTSILALMLIGSVAPSYCSTPVQTEEDQSVEFLGEFKPNSVEESGLVALQKIPVTFNGENSLKAAWTALAPHCTEIEVQELKRNSIGRCDLLVFRGRVKGTKFEIQKTLDVQELRSVIVDLPNLNFATSFKMAAENYPVEFGKISSKLPNVTNLTCHCRALFYEDAFKHLKKIKRIDCTQYDTYLFPEDLEGHCRNRFPNLRHFKIWYRTHNGG